MCSAYMMDNSSLPLACFTFGQRGGRWWHMMTFIVARVSSPSPSPSVGGGVREEYAVGFAFCTNLKKLTFL
jgi:hypothetical protein